MVSEHHVKRYPVVKMVIPTYRRPEQLKRILVAVHGEICDHFSVVVVDDNSGSPWLQKYQVLAELYPNVIWCFQHQNSGACAARNIGSQSGVRPSWIWFFDDDDYVEADVIRRIIDYLAGGVAQKLILLPACVENRKGMQFIVPKGQHINALFSTKGHEVNTSCAIFYFRLFTEIGGWDEQLVAGQDTDIFLRVSEHTDANVIEDVYVHVIHHTASRITSNPAKQMRGKRQFLIKNWRRLSWPRRIRYLITYVFMVPYFRNALAR